MNSRFLTILSTLILIALLATACGPGAPAATPTPIPSPTPAAPKGDAAAGQKAYMASCTACHGPEAKGVQGLGKDLTTSEYVKSKSDSELVEFFKVGRPSSDPLNTTGVDMPPRGGNPALSDTDLLNIVAFLRSIQQ